MPLPPGLHHVRSPIVVMLVSMEDIAVAAVFIKKKPRTIRLHHMGSAVVGDAVLPVALLVLNDGLARSHQQHKHQRNCGPVRRERGYCAPPRQRRLRGAPCLLITVFSQHSAELAAIHGAAAQMGQAHTYAGAGYFLPCFQLSTYLAFAL